MSHTIYIYIYIYIYIISYIIYNNIYTITELIIVITSSSWWLYTVFQVGVLCSVTILKGAVDSVVPCRSYKTHQL